MSKLQLLQHIHLHTFIKYQNCNTYSIDYYYFTLELKRMMVKNNKLKRQ